MSPRDLLIHSGLLVLFVFGCAGCRSDTAARPIRHLILVSVDTLRADHLAIYGNPRVETPTFDALAREGVLFEDHISAAPTTLASHTSLMTGLWPHNHGVPRNGFQVAEQNRTLAEILKEAGFTTVGFIGAFPLDRQFGLDQGFERWDQPSVRRRRRADALTDAVLKWLEDNEPRRLFLFVHYFDVHSPYRPPQPWNRRYRTDALSMDGSLETIREVRKGLVRDRAETLPKSRVLADLYAGEVSWVDSQLAVLFEGLVREGLWSDALVLVTSDHGEAMDEHWERWNHGLGVYDETVRTPLLIRLPGDQLAGTRSDRLLSNVDVFPTLLDLLGLEPPSDIDGVSFAPLLRGESLSPRGAVFAEATRPHGPRFERGASWRNARKPASIRRGRWKLIHHPLTDRTELYDLDGDPGETANLLEDPSPEIRRVAAKLMQELRNWRARAGKGPEEAGPDSEARKHLEALGYVDG